MGIVIPISLKKDEANKWYDVRRFFDDDKLCFLDAIACLREKLKREGKIKK